MNQDHLTKQIIKFLQERGWDNPSPGAIAKSISIESSELLELFQWDDMSIERLKKDPEKLQEVQAEVGDIMIYCLQMTGLLGLSYEEIVEEKLAKVKAKYPAKEMASRPKNLIDTTEDEYLKIKKQHRKDS
jgi:dCTP diphosphatase